MSWMARKLGTIIISLVVLILGILLPVFVKNTYLYFATYMILTYITLSMAWNILGGYAGYVNFGTSAFYGIGAYTSAMLFLRFGLPMPIGTLAGGLMAAGLGALLGYSTFRLRGIYFAITTLAVAIMIQMFIVNTPELGGSIVSK
jgi:branched-chain amino acid transport system permease protein